MATKQRSKRNNPYPLIIENHPENYTGYPFLTLIQYRKQHLISIVDNADDKNIRAYVLDMCGPMGVDEELVIGHTINWFETGLYETQPLSIAFTRAGITPITSKILHTINVDFVTRIIGPLPKFETKKIRSIKRRRRKSIPAGMELHITDVFD